MPDILVTGTDTGVGKTVIAAALVYALRAQGVEAVGFKPAQTGVEEGVLSDAELLRGAAPGLDPALATLAEPLISLADPVAPLVASERAGVTVSLAEVIARVQALRRRGATVVVEGAGGLLVPMGAAWTMADLAAAVGLHALIVARPGLGTLNAVLLTVEALHRRGALVAGVVLNGRSATPDLAEETNPAVLARLLPNIAIVVVPRLDDPSAATVARYLPALG